MGRGLVHKNLHSKKLEELRQVLCKSLKQERKVGESNRLNEGQCIYNI